MSKNGVLVLAGILVIVVMIAGGCAGGITAPAVPTLVSPTDTQVIDDNALTLDWDDVVEPSEVTYEVQVDDSDETFDSLVVDESGLEVSTYTLESLADGSYYWRARAVDGTSQDNAGYWSTVWSFTKSAMAKSGDTVEVHYTGTLDDGTVFDSSIGGEPLQFIIGSGQTIPGFEQAVVGMKSGESKTITIPVDEAYGPYKEEWVLISDLSDIPADIDPQVGQWLSLDMGDGSQPLYVLVTEVTESTVTLDANHPLAVLDLTFDIQLVDIT